MTCHTNGMSASRRASTESRQYAFLRAPSLATLPFCLFISEASAPVNTSCQRKPSVITKMMCCVLCSVETWALDGRTEQKNNVRHTSATRLELHTEVPSQDFGYQPRSKFRGGATSQ